MAKATFHVQLRPDIIRWNGRVRGADLVRATQKKPSKPVSGTLLVKVTLDIPDAAFLPLEPEIDVSVPVDHTRAVLADTEPLGDLLEDIREQARRAVSEQAAELREVYQRWAEEDRDDG